MPTSLSPAFKYAIVLDVIVQFVLLQPLTAQVTPAEDSKLNYRVVGFSFPAKPEATQYIIEIANGRFTEKEEFAANIGWKTASEQSRAVIEVPSFGTAYTWRVVYKAGSYTTATGDLHYFATGVLPEYGTNTKRLRVTDNRRQVDGYALVDGINTIMYDMSGSPVWYLPETDSINENTDVKISPSGTITFLTRGDAYEIDYSGKVLWHAKTLSDLQERRTPAFLCHHELNKLSNGNYMVLTSAQQPQGPKQASRDGKVKFFPPMFFSTLMEFDTKGKMVWSWNSEPYIQQSDLHDLQDMYPKVPIDVHENAFYFDRKNSVVYLSMSGISRIVKIQYPSGKVMNEYGKKFAAGSPQAPGSPEQSHFDVQRLLANQLFSHPHALSRSDDGFLYLFNNNSTHDQHTIKNDYPQVLKMKESGSVLETAWAFDCKSIIHHKREATGGGGNIMVLSDGKLFVSMCSPYGDMFVVDANKNILWSAVAEVYRPSDESWTQYPLYRASMVSRLQLEQMIWRKP